GRGVETALSRTEDMEIVGVFTRRDPASVKTVTGVKVYRLDDAEDMRNDIDVMILCGGSATDLPNMGPALARNFNTVDSFDTHARIPEYFEAMDTVSRTAGKISIISVGWDPGLFSINRAYGEAVLPTGSNYTFWGKGVSQGHSDAVRRIPGVKNAIQYTIPIDEAIDAVRSGSCPQLTTGEKHLRECFVVAEEGADLAKIEQDIKTMPNYFADYTTIVHFVTEEELKRDHSAMPHGGFVIRSGETSDGTKHVIEYSLKLDSNPEFTSSVLVSYARAAWRLSNGGDCGCKTVLDIAPGLLSPKSAAQLRAELL
ncbi:MAG: diaminopimelate dehydrogenase, partial [Ruminococcaceae bacterium]|nr:diaminopimelate dehydrogenase [Oscillospiraceae bacterium]